MNHLLATISNPAIGGPQGESALGVYIGVAVKTILVLGAVVVLLLLAWGAFQILTSGGDSKGQEKGRNIIQNAIIGLVILAALFPIIKALEIILNISILNIEFPSVTLIHPAYAFSGGSIEDGAGGWPFANLGQIRSQFFLSTLLVGGLLCLAFIIFGAIRYILSGGDKMQTDTAKKIITAAVIGLIILVAAYPIGWVIGKVLGVPITGGFNWPRVGGGGGNPSAAGQRTGCLQSCQSSGQCSGPGFKTNTHYACHDNCKSEGGKPGGCYLECNPGTS